MLVGGHQLQDGWALLSVGSRAGMSRGADEWQDTRLREPKDARDVDAMLLSRFTKVPTNLLKDRVRSK